MILICNIYRDIDNLLSHFLQHYYNLGVRNFYFGIHSGESNPVWNRIDSFNKWGLEIKKWKSYDGPINGWKEGDTAEFLRQQIQDKWYIPTDLDEFHDIGQYRCFQELVNDCEKEEADFVYGNMIDRITENGSIPLNIDPKIDINFQFPVKAKITRPLMGAWDGKVILSKQHFKLLDGHHFPVGFNTPDFKLKVFSKVLKINHFKWFGKLKEKEEEKLESYREVGLGYYEENRKLLDYLEKYNDRLLEPPIEILSS